MFTRERDDAAAHRDPKARVFMAAGALEANKPVVGQAPSKAPRPDAIDMVRDMRAFERALKSRRYPGLQIHSTVIADEDHFTVAPAVLTRGLVWALGLRER